MWSTGGRRSPILRAPQVHRGQADNRPITTVTQHKRRATAALLRVPSFRAASIDSRTAWIALALAVGYYVLSRLGLAFVDSSSGVTVWPASGLALSAFLLNPRRRWPLLSVAVFVATLISQLPVHSLGPSSLMAAINTLGPCLAGLIVQSISGRRRVTLSTVRDVCGLLVGAVASTAVTALLGVLTMALAYSAPLGRSWVGWWLAGSVGTVVVTSIVIGIARPRKRVCSWLETAAILTLTTTVEILMFSSLGAGWPLLSRFAILLMPLLVWAALRLSSISLSAWILIVSVFSAVGTVHGAGPFANAVHDMGEAVQALQVFLLIGVGATLLVAATMAERRQVEARLIAREFHLAEVNKRLALDARHDQLTGLRNRRALTDDVRDLEGAGSDV
jgi:integral membrane sensor domain MASE1